MKRLFATCGLVLMVATISAATCGDRSGETACPFDEDFEPCAPSCAGDPEECACPESKYEFTKETTPCDSSDGCASGFTASGSGASCVCTATTPSCESPIEQDNCATPSGSGDCCDGRPLSEGGNALYSTARCWPFADDGSDSGFDSGDEAMSMNAVIGACARNKANYDLHGETGTYTTVGKTLPLNKVQWTCESDFDGANGCPSQRQCDRILIQSLKGLTTPANAPNGEQFWGRDPWGLDLTVHLTGDFINQSCSAWKDHKNNHPIVVGAANIILGGTMIGSHFVMNIPTGKNFEFHAWQSCVIGGDYVGIDTARVGDIPSNELDCDPSFSEVRKHGNADGSHTIVTAPMAAGGLVDLAYPFATGTSGEWKLKATDGGVCVKGHTLQNVTFDQLKPSDCRIKVSNAGGTETDGSCGTSEFTDFCE